MRRMLAVGVALTLVMTLASATSATRPSASTDVSGTWTWVYTNRIFTPMPTGDMVVDGTDAGTWTGTFEGSSDEVFRGTRTPPFGAFVVGETWGDVWGALTVTFTGRVDGKHGGMTMWVTYHRPAQSQAPADALGMSGTWVILSGTEALKNVTGSGTWVSAADGASTAPYEGTITWHGED
jgi:hypothetical protein